MRILPTIVKTLLATLAFWAAGSSPASAVLLYDQTSNPGSASVTSQNFEAGNDAFDNRAADDFVVAAGGWTIMSLFVDGTYFGGQQGPATSVNVIFYADNGLKPGTVLASLLNQSMSDTAGDFTITLPVSIPLVAGTYWVSVQANMDFNPSGQWGWLDRTVTSGDPAAWINPGGAFATACTTDWGRRGADCNIFPDAPDQIFSLSGTVGISAIPEPGSIALLGIALGAFGLSRSRKPA